MTHEQLVNQVFEYTRDTIAAFLNAGVLPDMVQIGNEITHRMMWPDGMATTYHKEIVLSEVSYPWKPYRLVLVGAGGSRG